MTDVLISAGVGEPSSNGETHGLRLLTLGTLALQGPSGTDSFPSLGPRKLALLAYIALARRPLTRDHLAELFWGDRGDERARHSLREALSGLRRALGDAAIARGGDLVSLTDRIPLRIDAVELRRASAAGDAAAVVAIHVGPFLDGLHVTGASSAFERWITDERAEMERLLVDACASECRRLRTVGDWTARAAVARRWVGSDPLDPRAAKALLKSLAAPGTRMALQQALNAYAALVARLAAEFELKPDPSVSAIAETIARELAAHPGEPLFDAAAAAAGEPETVSEESAAPTPVGPRPPVATAKGRWQWPVTRNLPWFALFSLSLVTGAVVWAARGPTSGTEALASRAGTRPYVAVLATSGHVADDDCWLMEAMPHLLAASLGRAAGLETIALPELPTSKNAGGCDSVPSDAMPSIAKARRAGATIAVQPRLARIGREYALSVEVSDLRSGRSLRKETVADSVPFALAERTAVVLTPALAVSGGSSEELIGVETRSVEAYTAYMEALRHGADGRDRESTAALDRAVAADSGFVTALAERLRRSSVPGAPATTDTLRRLIAALERHLNRATPYDRLDLEATMATFSGDHARAEELARDLARAFPHDPRATGRLAELLWTHGRFTEATEEIERARELDSLAAAPRRPGTACGLCLVQASMAGILVFAGRMDDAERITRLAVAEHPERPAVWAGLSELLAGRGAWEEALAAAERARAAAPNDAGYALEPVRRLIEAGRLEEAERRLRPWLAHRNQDLAEVAADLEALRLRELGRHGEAVRVLARWARGAGRVPGAADMVRAASFATLGDFADAEASLAVPPPAIRSGNGLADTWLRREDARVFAWSRALLADALVVSAEARGTAVDTLRLHALADSLEVIGAQSYYGRDWRLHHHVRGLIAAREHRWAEAAREFEQARWTRTGWPRTLIELARAQLALGQPERALTTLADARGTVLNSMGRYVTRSEIAFWTSLAHDAAGRPDSARVYAAVVRRAWRHADPIVRRRLESLPTDPHDVAP